MFPPTPSPNESNSYRFGFHRPPFNNVDHLHLHCMAFPYISWHNILSGCKQLGLSLVVTATLHRAFTGVVSSLLLCSMENGRWLQASDSSFIVIADLCCAH
ncbi:unnamed protein product [Sphagnum balticum]